MFRLHMDFPLTTDENESVASVAVLINFFQNHKQELIDMGFTDINYRLGHDDDRQKSNYLIKNQNGHVANKKSRIHLLPQNSEVE
jgi:hypothetical protein